MNWDRYRSVMEQYAIKTDDMATEDAYFMATHMPFAQLEVYEGGQTTAKPSYKTESQIFDELICNPNNLHRMIIVRGNNGTGKSHLIRYMKAKLENSPSTIYNPKTEQIIFLRRLNNSVRGVFSQLLDQDVIRDQDVAEKMRRFVKSSESKDEASFKTEILFAYIAAVANDKSNTVYKAVDCRNIAQYLSDSRVQDHLMREDGAISRCYRVITTPSDQVLKETRIFTEDDFGSKEAKKVNRTVKRDGNPDAQDFVQTIFNDDDEVVKLVDYLNRFTGSVVQRCADISSETTKSVFEQLRRDLKKQGKNLTLFIEDFTGFTGIDSELITVLSTEHGGDYDYLCRVTAIIGITDGYYDQFKDNFKDRVTHQISVTERSFGTSDFLEQMSALYLNAIFCSPDDIHSWYKSGADINKLPQSGFALPCEWESVSINGRTLSLFPFNKAAINKLYNLLPVKTPRMFLRDVIKRQLKEYFDGKEYGDEWKFPYNPGSVQMTNGPHSSAIDRNDNLSLDDQQRLKVLLAVWGDGSASGVKYADGSLFIGGVNKKFLNDIGLTQVSPIGEIEIREGQGLQVGMSSQEQELEPQPVIDEKKAPEPTKQKETPEERNYRRWMDDISSWYSSKTSLQYDDTYRTWIKVFLVGNNNQCGAINWQDIGIPAYIANERLSNLASFYIQDQSNNGREDRALVYVPRNVESRDMLIALLEHQYHKNWDFKDSTYYQQRLITWLEKNKRTICQKVMQAENYAVRMPIAVWGLELQFIKAIVYGYAVDRTPKTETIIRLFENFTPKQDGSYSTKEWADLVSFLKSKEAELDSAYDLLTKGHNSTMGAIAGSKDPKTFVYHADELLQAIQELFKAKWNPARFLQDTTDKNLLTTPVALLKDLEARLNTVADAEQQHFKNTKAKLEELIGDLSEANLLEVINAVKSLLSVFNQNGIPVKSALSDRFHNAPIEITQNILKALAAVDIKDENDTMAILSAYSNHSYSFTPSDSENNKTAMEVLTRFQQDLLEIERLAQQEEKKAKAAMSSFSGDDATDLIAEAAKSKLESIYDTVEAWEVI